MGANAQTTVQKFVDGAVLTAAQQNTSAATGVPVFATTVTRDAAFGGSNKVLAEGQTCYLEDANVVQYYDGAAWVGVGGKVAQVVQATYAIAVSTTSTSYVTTGLSATITPSSSSSRVMVQVTNTLLSAGNEFHYITLFRGTVAGTNLATNVTKGFTQYGVNLANVTIPLGINYVDSPATTSATTYTLGFRSGSAVSVTAQYDTATATMILTEILA